MSGTTPPPAVSLAKLAAKLASRPGKAGGRDKRQDALDELSKRRKDRAAAEALRLLQSGAEVDAADPVVATLKATLGLSDADLADAAVAPAQSAPAGSATGTLALAANNGAGTIAIPGQALTAPAVGYWAEVALQSLDAAGTATAAVVNVLVKRASGNAVAAASVTNRFGTDFGPTGTTVTVAATCAADGATATLTLTNTGAAARSVAYAVLRRAAG